MVTINPTSIEIHDDRAEQAQHQVHEDQGDSDVNGSILKHSLSIQSREHWSVADL
jgi:hypothetical protein